MSPAAWASLSPGHRNRTVARAPHWGRPRTCTPGRARGTPPAPRSPYRSSARETSWGGWSPGPPPTAWAGRPARHRGGPRCDLRPPRDPRRGRDAAGCAPRAGHPIRRAVRPGARGHADAVPAESFGAAYGVVFTGWGLAGLVSVAATALAARAGWHRVFLAFAGFAALARLAIAVICRLRAGCGSSGAAGSAWRPVRRAVVTAASVSGTDRWGRGSRDSVRWSRGLPAAGSSRRGSNRRPGCAALICSLHEPPVDEGRFRAGQGGGEGVAVER